jgi:hypothetical protein
LRGFRRQKGVLVAELLATGNLPSAMLSKIEKGLTRPR